MGFGRIIDEIGVLSGLSGYCIYLNSFNSFENSFELT